MKKKQIKTELTLDHQLKTLSEIGQDITSSLSVERIIERSYKKVNSLMDASVFWIGLYNEEQNRIDFPGPMEKGEKLPSHTIDLNDSNRHAVWCFTNQKEIFTNDILKDYTKYFPGAAVPKPTSGEGTNSMIYLPLSFQDKRIGVITVQSFEKNAYTQYHLDIFRNMSIFIATALQNAKLYEDVETKVKERTDEVTQRKEEVELSYRNIKTLSEIGQEIISSLTVEAIIDKTYKKVNSLMDASVFGIGLYNKEQYSIDFLDVIEKEEKLPFHFESLHNDIRPSVWCFKNQQDFFTNDYTEQYNQFFPGVDLPPPTSGDVAHSIIYLPLSFHNKRIGVITVQSFRRDAYTEYHTGILRNLAVYVSIALENARVYENLEEKVKERTREVTIQKDELEKSFQNIKLLGEIGQQITSSLSVEKIIETAYGSINELMDASSFWIGIYNENTQRLDYPLGKEKGKTLPYAYYNLTDDKWLPVWSFKNQKEIFVNDYEREYNKYIPDSTPPKPIAGAIPQSSIWYPLVSKDGKPLGIITIQAFQKNAYTQYHLSIVRNLAVFTSIALENALLYERVEQKVTERTAEVVKQKEEIELSYRNIETLSEIGRDIASSLSVEIIIDKIYKKINSLMDASVFGIGLINEAENRIDIPGMMEKGEKMPLFFYNLNDALRPAVWCYKNQKEFFTNDYDKDFNKYFPNAAVPAPSSGEQSHSLIYLPLTFQNKKIGIITVQSFKKNAYTQYHYDILRNLTVYIASALENAHLYENVETKVKERTAEVMRQQEELEQMHKEITDSIHYARTIQDAILPFADRISHALKDFFIYYQPKAIVSGDFYWFAEVDGKQIIAAADCTGHGVPGAFMSMIGNDLLNDIVNVRGIVRPDLILNELHKGIRYVLKQEQTHNQDGMDIALIVIDTRNKKIQYSGAKNPLVYVSNNECQIVKADKLYIGGTQLREEQERLFKLNEIDLSSPLTLYLFSDGFADQFGGPRGKKFKYKQLQEVLLANSDKPLIEQKMIIGKVFEEWKGNLEQVDDVLVIGIRV